MDRQEAHYARRQTIAAEIGGWSTFVTGIALVVLASLQFRVSEHLARLEDARSEPRFSLRASDIIEKEFGFSVPKTLTMNADNGVKEVRSISPEILLTVTAIDAQYHQSRCEIEVDDGYHSRGPDFELDPFLTSVLELHTQRLGPEGHKAFFLLEPRAIVRVEYADLKNVEHSATLQYVDGATRSVSGADEANLFESRVVARANGITRKDGTALVPPYLLFFGWKTPVSNQCRKVIDAAGWRVAD